MRATLLLLAGILVTCSSIDDPTASPAEATPTMEPAHTTVGTDGGTVEEEGLKLTIPEGALSEDVDIEVSASPAAAVEGGLALSPTYELGPDGTTFAAPVTVTLTATEDPPPGALVFWGRRGEPPVPLPTTWRGREATFTLDHFSEGGLWSAIEDFAETMTLAAGCKVAGLGDPGQPCCAGRCFNSGDPNNRNLCLNPEIVIEDHLFPGWCQLEYTPLGDLCDPGRIPCVPGAWCKCFTHSSSALQGECVLADEWPPCTSSTQCKALGFDSCETDWCDQGYCSRLPGRR